MRALLLLSCIAVATIVATVSTSRGDGDTEATNALIDTPVMPFKGAEAPMKDPFVPYGTGAEQEPGAVWKYEDLTAHEKIVADRGLDEDQTAVQNAYASAARAMGQRAKAEGAAVMLGIDSPLEQLGVVTGEPNQEEPNQEATP